jgi:hypothetical protein
VIICGFLQKQAIKGKFPLFSLVIGHFWPMKGIFVYGNPGVSWWDGSFKKTPMIDNIYYVFRIDIARMHEV